MYDINDRSRVSVRQERQRLTWGETPGASTMTARPVPRIGRTQGRPEEAATPLLRRIDQFEEV